MSKVLLSVQAPLVDVETQAPVLPALYEDTYLIGGPKRKQVMSLLTAKMPVQTLALIPAEHNRISYLGRKVFTVLVCIAQRQGPNIVTYRAKLSEVIVGMDFTSNNTEHLKETIKSMVSTLVVWQSPTARETTWTASTLVAEVTIQTDGSETWIEWSYSQFMQQAIHDGYLFAKINMEVQSKLKTYAGLALYSICYRYKGHPSRTPAYPWEWWRPVLTGKSIEDANKTFAEWKYFNRDVVRKGVREVNAVTDIQVEAVATSRGKTIELLSFNVLHNTKAKPKLEEGALQPVDMSLVERAIRLKITGEEAEKLLSQYGEEVFLLGLISLEGRHGKEPIRNTYAYLVQCMKNESEKAIDIKEASRKTTPAKSMSPEEPKAPRPIIASLNSPQALFVSSQLEAAQKIRESLTAEQLRDLEQEFEAAGFPGVTMSRTTMEKWRAKGSKMGPYIDSSFRVFIARKNFGEQWNVLPPGQA